MKLYKNALILVMTLVVIAGCNQKKPLYIEVSLTERLKDVTKGERATIGIIKNIDGADYSNNMMSNASTLDSVDIVDGKISFTLSGEDVKDAVEKYYISITNKDSKNFLVSTFAKAGDSIKITFEDTGVKKKGSTAENYLNLVDSINKGDSFTTLNNIGKELLEITRSMSEDSISQVGLNPKGQELYNKYVRLNDSLMSLKIKLLLEKKEHHGLVAHELFNLFNYDFYGLELFLKSMNFNTSSFPVDDSNTFRDENLNNVKLLLTDNVKTHPIGNIVHDIVTYSDAFKVSLSSDRASYENLKAEFDALDDENKASIFGVRIQKKLEKLVKLSVGNTPPDIITKKIDGSDFKLSEVKNKVVLLDFWASWCGPCRMENPKYVDLYNKFKDKGLEIIAYSLDTDREKWEEAIKEDKLTWEHIGTLLNPADDPVVENYQINSIPSNYLLVDGKIVKVNVFGEQLEKLIAEHL